MKYIKKFEYLENNKFWLIPTKLPDFDIALDKIVLSENIINPAWKEYHLKTYNFYKKYKKIYVSTEIFSWDFLKKTFIDEGQKYMGRIEITPEDFKEWEFKNDIKNFNL